MGIICIRGYNMSKQRKEIKTDEERAIPKSITIMPRHQKFIEDKSINLSKFLQKKLDEEIELQGWKEPQE